LSVEVKIHCFWLITSILTLPTSAYFWYGGSHILYSISTFRNQYFVVLIIHSIQ